MNIEEDKRQQHSGLQMNEHLSQLLGSLQERWQLAEDDILTLLFYFCWSEEKLNIALCRDERAVRQMLLEVGVESVFEARTSNPFCTLCEEKKSTLIARKCGHGCCPECWLDYLTTSIRAFQVGACLPALKCPYPRCTLTLPVSFVRSILTEGRGLEEYAKYERVIIKCFVASSTDLICCPTKHCNTVFHRHTDFKSVLTCDSCETEMCPCCRHKTHFDIPCTSMQDWSRLKTECKAIRTKLQNKLPLHLINPMTKPCPVCKAAVNAQAQCTSVFCGMCQTTFCWRCLRVISNPYQTQRLRADCEAGTCSEFVFDRLSSLGPEKKTKMDRFDVYHTKIKEAGLEAKQAAQLKGLRQSALLALFNELMSSTPSDCNLIQCFATFYNINERLAQLCRYLMFIYVHAYVLDAHKNDMETLAIIEENIVPLYRQLQNIFCGLFQVSGTHFDIMNQLMLYQGQLEDAFLKINSTLACWRDLVHIDTT